jgi:hypothetical protein
VLDLDLVGDGPLRSSLEDQAKALGIENLVHFHGAVEVERAMGIVAGADLVVMPSVVLADGRRDGIPVALMEAMAVGVPVVASAVSGIPELVRDGETGLLVAPEDPEVLAGAVESVLDDPEAAAVRAAAGRELVEAEYDIHASGAGMIEIWQRCAEGHGPGGVQMSRPRGPRIVAVVIGAVIGALAALGWGTSQSDVYRAEAVLTFGPSDTLVLDADVIDVIGALDDGALPETAAGLATSGSVRTEGASRIGLDEGSGDYSVTATPVFDANLLDVATSGPDPVVAADLTNAIADVLTERIEGLYQVYVVDVVTRATPPAPESRSLGLLVLAGALFAAAAVAAVIVGVDRTGIAPGRAGPR